MHRLASGERGGQTALEAHVPPSDVDVHEGSEDSALVQEEVGDGECGDCLADRRRLELEALPPSCLAGEDRREDDYDRQTPTSTDRTGGSCDAISDQLLPSSADAKTEPLCVPT